jgi:CheY-like chemotaxis protein
MPESLKVLIVDDSAIYRSLVQGCLREMADVKCVGTAVDGKDAIAKAAELRPDVILLDVEMPVMNGVEAMPKLRSLLPQAGIIMVSSLTTNGANVTMEALQAGAFDFVTKPQVKAGEDGFAALREPLATVIGAFREGRAQRARPAKAPVKPSQARGKVPAIDLVAIGSSTGGPQALAGFGAVHGDQRLFSEQRRHRHPQWEIGVHGASERVDASGGWNALGPHSGMDCSQVGRVADARKTFERHQGCAGHFASVARPAMRVHVRSTTKNRELVFGPANNLSAHLL